VERIKEILSKRNIIKFIGFNMIFISVGNNKDSFIRIFKKFDRIKNDKKNNIQKVLAQVGYTKVNYKYLIKKNFIEKKIFLNYLKKSQIFITHCGAGNIIDALCYKKIPLVLPRQQRLQEHVDDHQVELCSKLLKLNLIKKLKKKNFNNLKKNNIIYNKKIYGRKKKFRENIYKIFFK